MRRETVKAPILRAPVVKDDVRRPWPRTFPPPVGGRMARLRAWWWDNIALHVGETCGCCGRRYTDTPWHAPADLWRRVVQGRVALICPGCFNRWALAEGLGRVVFVPTLGTDAWDVHDPINKENE
ncbi:MAG: hypothetical protein V4472_24865 [Pseudomonadota bacterium]